MWWDMEKVVDSKKCFEFLKHQKVKLYYTFSETKVSIAEQMIRTLKTNVKNLKHNMNQKRRILNARTKGPISYMIYYHMFLKNIILKQFIALYK